jgi:class 3 adenylate cyclase
MARALATTRALRSDNPRVAHDPALQQWWPRARRLHASPYETARQMEYAANVDIESVLEAVRAPALVFHRRDNQLWDLETSRAAAARMPKATFVELPGSDLDLFLGDTAPVLSEIARFLGHDTTPVADDRTLATILFTDIAASTEQLATVGDRAWRTILDEHDGVIERTVLACRGRLIKTLGDGILAIFDGPARAVHCATTLRDTLARRGIEIRAGLHTGEIEVRGPDVAGIAVHIASRISAFAQPSEILTSRTVVDLTSGSGITYDPRGDHALKGVPGSWQLSAVQTSG